MAQERPLTPEKQLLKLIEEPNAKNGHVQSQAIKHRGLSFLSPGAWMGRVSFLRDKLRMWGKGGRLQPSEILDVRAINRFLLLCVFLLAVILSTNISMSIANLNMMPSMKFKIPEGVKVAFAPAASRLKDLSFYVDKMRQRDIFKMGEKKKDEGMPEAKISQPQLADAVAHLKLVGISWSKDPDAMIEDTKVMRTFFIKRGQKVGEFKVQAIFKDKVVLSFEGQEVELK